MTHFTGYLLGKVQLEGAIRSEVLASLVETLIPGYQAAEPTKKDPQYNENHKFVIFSLFLLYVHSKYLSVGTEPHVVETILVLVILAS